MNLTKYDLNLLVTLNALLAERNVTRAARRLGVTQPTVSGALARLREVFKDELLVRVGRRLEPTPLALRLVEPVQQAIQDLEGLHSLRDRFDPTTERRTFRIRRTGLRCVTAAAGTGCPPARGGATGRRLFQSAGLRHAGPVARRSARLRRASGGIPEWPPR
jgi:hypothetical protein